MVFEYCWDSRLLSSASGFACWYWDTAVIRRVMSSVRLSALSRNFVVVEALSAASLTIRLMIRTVFADTSYGRQLIYRRGQHVGVRYVSTIA